MTENLSNHKTCVIIGASHAGVNCAFALRREGWESNIILFDADPEWPYHRPPLSKAYLTSEDEMDKHLLKSKESYDKEKIELKLGHLVTSIDRKEKIVVMEDGRQQRYDILVLATGGRPIIPSIPGINTARNLFPLRTAADANNIRETINTNPKTKVVVIGGGYIGLETAASLQKLGAEVTVLEREERVLARITVPEMSTFFQELHAQNGVKICTAKEVVSISTNERTNEVFCSDGSSYQANMIVVGIGIRGNLELAQKAGLSVGNGIEVNTRAKTSDDAIYAIGDCTFHYNTHYDCHIRLESVQNAVDQAKIAASAICGKPSMYNSIPWFWSDQFDVKFQIVGLSQGYDELVIRKEPDQTNSFSFWYFKGDSLLAVDAINNAKAYVYGTKFIKGGQKINKLKLADPTTEFKPTHLLIE